jgi:hypothetical protein
MNAAHAHQRQDVVHEVSAKVPVTPRSTTWKYLFLAETIRDASGWTLLRGPGRTNAGLRRPAAAALVRACGKTTRKTG